MEGSLGPAAVVTWPEQVSSQPWQPEDPAPHPGFHVDSRTFIMLRLRQTVTLKVAFFFFFLFLFLVFFWGAAPTAYGASQARGLIGAVAAGLHHSHSNARSEPCLQPIPQLMAMLDP